jgi:hypothetical protein
MRCLASMPLSHFQLAQPLETFCIPFAMFFPTALPSSTRIGLTTKLAIRNLSLSQSEIEKINELYALMEAAVDALESSKTSLNEFARMVANGDTHLPGPMILFFKVATDPLTRQLSPESLQDRDSNSDWRDGDFTVDYMHNEPEFSEKSIRTLERYFLGLQRSGVVLSTTKGKWGKRGSRPDNRGRTAYYYRLNPISRGPAATNNTIPKIDRDFLSMAEKFLARSPAYRELLARALSVILELASNPDFLSILWQIPGLKGLFEETDVGMIERIGKQLSLVIPAELVPISLVRQRLAVIGDPLCWDEAKRLRLEIDLG